MPRTLLARIAEPGQRFIRGLGRASRLLLSLNAFCWLLFLTRPPVNAVEYAPYRILAGGGIEMNGPIGGGSLIASRTVAPGGWHGDDTGPIEAYRSLNLPSLIAGRLVFLMVELPLVFVRLMAASLWEGPWMFPNLLPALESWLLAGILFLSTTLQWWLIGRLADRLLARVPIRGRESFVTHAFLATFVAIAAALTAWWWPAERDRYLLWSSFDGKPEPILKALESEPANAELWRRLGRSYRMKDRWVEARPAYRRSVELDPTDFDAWADLRLASLCLDDPREAERAARQLFVLDRKWAESRVTDPPKCCAFGVCPK